MRRSGVVWVAAADRRPKPVWHVWHDGADHVLHGGGEQHIEGLAGAERATVSVRAKRTGAGLLTWAATVDVVVPESDAWTALLPLLRAERLHAEPDPTERWRTTSTLSRLTPTGEVSALGPLPTE